MIFDKEDYKAFDPEPVSYTHLDVYKRQPLGRVCSKRAPAVG